MPVFRSLIAEELVRTYNLTQVEAAKRLGTTQAAVSQYLSSKRATKRTKRLSQIMPKIKDMARVTARRLANDEISADDVATEVCKLCSVLGGEEEPNLAADDYVI